MGEVTVKTGNNYSVIIARARSVVCALLAGCYLVNSIRPGYSLGSLLSAICLLCLLVCFPFAKNSARILTIILLAAGAVVLGYIHADTELWISSMSLNANLITLLILIPIFGLPLKYGGYYQVLDALVNKYMNNQHRVYWVPALLCHFFGALMNMGSIPVVYALIIHDKLPAVFRAVPPAILRGFSSSIYWSPNMISVALVTYYLHVSWADFARVGIVFAGVCLIVGWLVHIFVFKNKIDFQSLSANSVVDSKKLSELLVFCTIFLGTIIYIATRTKIPVLTAVPLLALIFPVIWLSLVGKMKSIALAYQDYFEYTLPKFASEITIFIGAGFVTSAILSSGSGEKISLLLLNYIGVNPYLLCLFIASSIVLLAFFGVTPMVTAMAYSVSLKPELIGVAPELLSLVLVGGWATGVIVSPFSGVTLIMSGLSQQSSFEVARDHWLFGIIMILLLTAVPLLQFCL